MNGDIRNGAGVESGMIGLDKQRSNRTFRRLVREKDADRLFQELFSNLPDNLEKRSLFIQELVDSSSPRYGEVVRDFPNVIQEVLADTALGDKDFLLAVREAFYDFLDRNLDPREFESKTRTTKEGLFIPLNEILSFGHDGEIIHIHLASARTLEPDERTVMITDGFEKLAKKFAEPEFQAVKKVTITSWIVAKKPEFFETFGFVTDGPIDESVRQEYFKDETGPISAAHIDREVFLKRYLK